MYNYKSLNNASYNEIVKCLNCAFSNYYLPIQLIEKELQTHFEMNGVDKKLSLEVLKQNYKAIFENEL